MRRWQPLQNVRGRLLTILLVALAAALGASTYGFNVLFAQTTSRSADSLLRARASTELALLSIKNGRLASAEISDDTVGDNQVWIFGRTSLVERPPAHTTLDPVASSLAEDQDERSTFPKPMSGCTPSRSSSVASVRGRS